MTTRQQLPEGCSLPVAIGVLAGKSSQAAQILAAMSGRHDAGEMVLYPGSPEFMWLSGLAAHGIQGDEILTMYVRCGSNMDEFRLATQALYSGGLTRSGMTGASRCEPMVSLGVRGALAELNPLGATEEVCPGDDLFARLYAMSFYA